MKCRKAHCAPNASGLHKSLGITVFIVTALRLAWRMGHRPPALPDTLPAWQRKLASGVQHLFYLLLFAQPFLGYLSSVFSKYQTAYLGLTLPTWAAPDQALNGVFNELHAVGGTLLLVASGLHVLGAVAHLCVCDGRFGRMLPWGR